MDKIDKANSQNKEELFDKSIEIKTKNVDGVHLTLNYWKEFIEEKPPQPKREYKENSLTVTIPPPSEWEHVKHKDKYEFHIAIWKECNYPYTKTYSFDLDTWKIMKKAIDKLVKEAKNNK